MAKDTVICILKACTYPVFVITLPDNKIVYLGRTGETRIIDPMVSRKQIAATADYRNYSVLIEVCGTNNSGCNGYALNKNTKYNLKHGDYLELLVGKYKFEVIFDPPPPSSEVEHCDTLVAKQECVKDANIDLPKPILPNITNATIPKLGSWENIDNGDLFIYTMAAVKPQSKIAAFDLDGTLIKTKSGARFAKDSLDWIINFSNVSNMLKQLFCDDFKIVIFSNQAGIGKNNAKITAFKTKVEDILSDINVPVQVFFAPTKSIYRKPLTGMWSALCNEKNNGVEIDVSKSFYVGDAAGRPKNWAPEKDKDHSVSDRLFSINLNLKFYTPEEYFLNACAVSFDMPKFDPRNLVISKVFSYSISGPDVIVLVGCPASGKSQFCRNFFESENYVHMNADSLEIMGKCMKLLDQLLKSKQNVVIDNTNPDKASRKKYINIAKANKYPVRCFLMTTALEHCKHNNKFRSLTDKHRAPVNDVILNIYQKNFEEPTIDEGFTEIVKVDFIPEFKDAEEEKLYKMFLLES